VSYLAGAILIADDNSIDFIGLEPTCNVQFASTFQSTNRSQLLCAIIKLRWLDW
jgi:hypothetical protein